MSRPSNIDGMASIAGEGCWSKQARGDRGLKHFSVPIAVIFANERACGRTFYCSFDGAFHSLKGLPIATRCKGVEIIAVDRIALWIPTAGPYPLNELGCNGVSFD